MTDFVSPKKQNKYARRLEALKAERQTWLSHWKEISDYLDPRGVRYLETERNDGRKKGQKIINSVASLALRSMQSGMMSGLTNPEQPWFKLNIADKRVAGRKPVKVWLEDCAETIAEVLHQSNVYNVLHSAYRHLGAYGICAILVEEDDVETVRATLLPIGQYCLATDADSRVNTLYREYSMTVGQLVDKYGIDNVTDNVARLYRNEEFDTWIPVIHVIEPRQQRDFNSKLAKDMKFASIVLEKNAPEGKVLKEGGYQEFPVMCPRWDRVGEDVYGESPGMLALPDIKELQTLEKKLLEALEKSVNPPMVLVGEVRSPTISLQPGAITRVPQASGENGFKPAYMVNPDVGNVAQKIEKVEHQIKRMFFEDLFLIVSQLDNVRTATDIIERKTEKLMMLGPVVQNLMSELLNPLIDRVFAICQRAGKFTQAPDELYEYAQGSIEMLRSELRPKYESVLVAAQRSQSTGHIESFFQLSGPVIQVDPDSAMRVNWDEVLKDVAMKTGVTAKALRDDDEVEAMKAQAAQQRQAQQGMDQLVQGAQGAKLLADAKIDPNTALGSMMGATGMRGI